MPSYRGISTRVSPPAPEVDGGNGRQLTDNEDEDRCPQWPPDGLRLSFYSERDEDREIYVMNADGSEQTRLTNSAGIGSSLPRT